MKARNTSSLQTRHHRRHYIADDTDYSSVEDEVDAHSFHNSDIEQPTNHRESDEPCDDANVIQVNIPKISSSSHNKKYTQRRVIKDIEPREEQISMGGETCATKSTAMIIGVALVAGAIIGFIALVHLIKDGNIHFFAARNGAEQTTNMISLEELALHNTANDCWIVYYGIVYNMTTYAMRHPGGSEIITRLAGTDGTDEYERFHSESLLQSVQSEIVGTLSTDSQNDMDENDNSSSNDSNNNDSSSNITPPPPADDDCLLEGNNCVTMAELQSHNTVSDCWVSLYGIVYDLTDYAQHHPGGPNFVTDLAGTDGTTEYARFHRKSLLRSVQGDIVGALFLSSLEDSENEHIEDDNGNNEENNNSNNNNNNNNNNNGDDTNAFPPSTTPVPSFVGDFPDCVTFVELQRHNTISDCWVALYGNVYDLTSYAQRHPGGSRIVTDLAGTDGTSHYARFHRNSLLDHVQNYLIGPYEGGTGETGNNNSNHGHGGSGGHHHS